MFIQAEAQPYRIPIPRSGSDDRPGVEPSYLAVAFVFGVWG